MELLFLKTENFSSARIQLPAPIAENLEPSKALIVDETSIVVPGADKSLKPVEYVSRIFSPHLTPSAVHVENRQLAQSSIAPVYRHNIALTKYFNVSTTPKLLPHLHTNLIA